MCHLNKETGICLPDVSLFKPLCEVLGITLNEFFVGEKLKEENYKEKADENLLQALENSTFAIKEKIVYFKNKWEKEHFFELIITMLIIVFFIIYGFIKNNKVITILFIIIGFVSGMIEHNRKLVYIEKNVSQNKNLETESKHENNKRI